MIANVDEPIAAIASARGHAPRGVVRCSGRDIAARLDQCIRLAGLQKLENIRAATVLAARMDLGRPVGPFCIRLVFWPGTRTYTRQPSAEIHCAGSPIVLQEILRVLGECGIRQAMPGEFTLRAFLAGRIDLTEAEAVLETIDARSASEMTRALRQMSGGLADSLATVRDQLLDLVARIEAGLDFADEDISFISAIEIADTLRHLLGLLRALDARLVERHAGEASFRVVLAGRPNAGKSSLFNALLARAGKNSFALVSPVAGTTRDVLSADIRIGGLPFRLEDTAGLSRSEEVSQCEETPRQQARHKALEAQRAADLVLLCVDGSVPLDETEKSDLARITSSAGKMIVVNKSDLPRHPDTGLLEGSIAVSARTGENVDNLLDQIALRAGGAPDLETGMVRATAERCMDRFRQAIEGLSEALEGVHAGEGDEVVAARLRVVLDQLNLISGKVYTEDILDRVFSRFCIGK